MKELSRRDFFKKGLVAAGAFFVASSPLAGRSLLKQSAAEPELTVEQLMENAKAHFYLKEYEEAAQCYRNVIGQEPDFIAGYDGLAKVFRAQNRLLTAAETYREGWLTHRSSPVFTDRLAIAMRRLAAGNRKQERAFCALYGEEALYEAAAQLYIDVMEQQNDTPAYLSLGLMDIQKAVEKHNKERKGHRLPEQVALGAATTQFIAAIDQGTQSRWRGSRRNRKKSEYDVQSEEQLNSRKHKHEARERRKLHFHKEKLSREREFTVGDKRLYYPLFIKSIKNKSTKKAEDYYKGIIAADSGDTNATGKMIRYYREQKEYTKLVQLQKQRHEKEPDNLWLAASYAQALRLQAKEENKPSNYATAYNLYKQLGQSEQLEAYEKLVIYGGEIDCLFKQGKYTEAKAAILRVMAPYPLPILPYLIVYLRCLTEEGQYPQAGEAFQVLLEGTESTLLAADPIYPHLQNGHILIKLPTGKKIAVEGYGLNKEELFDIYYAMVKLYEKSGNGGAKSQTLSAILEIDPNNRFAQKRG